MTNQIKITIGIILGLTVIAGSFWYFSKLQETKLQKTNTKLTQNNTAKNISNNQNQEQEKNQKQKNDNQNQTIDGELKPEEKIDTSDWKTYRNEKFGFEIKLPGNLKKWNIQTEKYDKENSKYKGSEYFITFSYKNDANIPDIVPAPKDPSKIHYMKKKYERLILLNVVPIENYVKNICIGTSDPMCREGIEIGRNKRFVFLQMPLVSEPLCQNIPKKEQFKSDFCNVEKVLSGPVEVVKLIQFKTFN